jgi:hypothetical protein
MGKQGTQGRFAAVIAALAISTVTVITTTITTAITTAVAQESSLRAERTVDYKTSKAVDLTAKVGPVKITSVEFSKLGRGYGHGGIAGKMRGGGTLSEVSTTLRAHFLAENPSPDEWEVTFTLEYLDKAGKVIERVTKKSSWEGEAKPYDFDHEILEYVLPLIAQVHVKLEGRLD